MRDLTDVLDEIYYQYDLGYEDFHGEALRRAIEIIKEHKADEPWTEEKVKKRQEETEKELQKGINHG